MSLTFQQLADEAMKLTPEERVNLAEKLRVSVDAPETIAAAWDAEAERRMKELDAGTVDLVPFEDVITELRTTLQ